MERFTGFFAISLLAAGITAGAVLVPGEWRANGMLPIPLVREEVRLLFVGDLLYDRTIRTVADREGDAYIFSCMADELQKYDAVIANLEGPITSNPSVSAIPPFEGPDNTRFTMPLRTASVLAANNIRAVSLGNNHIRDYGIEGVEETRRTLASASVQYFGDPKSPSVALSDAPVVLVAFNEFGGSLEETLGTIRANKGNTVIVFAHWGNEYEPATERQKEWARMFVDAGADLVLGAHPHVVQESEIYKGVPIYYSLGNFIFDQYFDESVMLGLALEVVVSERGVESVKERPVNLLRDRRSCIE